MTELTSGDNVCGTCGENFASVSLFDRHRVGKHAYTYTQGLRFIPPVEDGRRCLSIGELEERGYVKNTRGRWHDPVAVERMREAFGHG